MGHKIDNGDAPNLSTGMNGFTQSTRIAAKECGYKQAEVGLSDKPAGVFARGRDTKKQGEHGFQYSIEFRNEIRQGIQYLDPIERVRE